VSASLAFHDVSCWRGGRMLFEAVSFALTPGQALLVSGPNGAGKSSLIRVAAGLLPPVEGRVEGEGARALLGEAHALDPELPLKAALRFWAASSRVDKVLAAVGLSAIAEVPVRLLSTGQRRRAGIARVIASDAPVWLLDEPANGLDLASVAVLEAIIARHRAAGGIAVVATHLPIDLPEAAELPL
jgi:heme exporter protein A